MAKERSGDFASLRTELQRLTDLLERYPTDKDETIASDLVDRPQAFITRASDVEGRAPSADDHPRRDRCRHAVAARLTPRALHVPLLLTVSRLLPDGSTFARRVILGVTAFLAAPAVGFLAAALHGAMADAWGDAPASPRSPSA